MNAQDITTIITSIGFPSFMCYIMFQYVKTLTESHKEETNNMTDAINQLKITIQKLIDKLNADIELEEKTDGK